MATNKLRYTISEQNDNPDQDREIRESALIKQHICCKIRVPGHSPQQHVNRLESWRSSMKQFFRIVSLALSAVLLCVAAGEAAAQHYPSKPIRLIVAFPPAGATDVVARAIGQKLSEALGQQVFVENRPGAGGNIGAEAAAKSAPDGYTLFLAALTNHAIAASVYSKLNYDLTTSFTPVSLVANVPHMLVAHPSLPVNSVKELIELAKAKPGVLNAASQGNGTLSHLELELFKSFAGVNLLHVPYKGSSNAMPDLLAGQVSLFFDSIPSALPQVKAGKLKALGVLTSKRLAFLPNIPTIAESGLPGFEANNWFAVLAPAGTPKDIVNLLNAEIAKVVATPDLREHLASQGAILEGSTPEQLSVMIKSDLAKWAKVVKDSGARID
jgi:tripartite-type tricarboxylate transporter receptor subunit TctC